MQKWITATLLSFIIQSSMVEPLLASRYQAQKQIRKNLPLYNANCCNKQGPTGPEGDQGTAGGGAFA